MHLAEFERAIDRLEYPITTEQVARRVGDRRLDYQDGSEPVAKVLGRFGPEVFASADEVRMTVYGALPVEAVGRKGYSDRDPPGVDEVEQVSF